MEKELDTIIGLFEGSCRKFPQNPCLWVKQDGRFSSVSYPDVRENVLGVAAGLIAAGLAKGDRVALLGEACSDWLYGDLGILFAGGVSVPLDLCLEVEDLHACLKDSGARFIFVSVHALPLFRKCCAVGTLPVERIFVMGAEAPPLLNHTSFADLKREGMAVCREDAQCLEARTASVKGGDTAHLLYRKREGTCEGFVLSHSGIAGTAVEAAGVMPVQPQARLMLPWVWDCCSVLVSGVYMALAAGASMTPAETYPGNPANLVKEMRRFRPHVMFLVPALTRSFRSIIEHSVKKSGKGVEAVYRWGLKIGGGCYASDGSGTGLRMLLRPLLALWNLILFRRIRQLFGGEIRSFIGYEGHFGWESDHYFRILGMPLYQGYGPLEASGLAAQNTPGPHRYGSSGHAVEGIEIRIRDGNGRDVPAGETGEIVLGGSRQMKGIWKDGSCKDNVSDQGWLHTGDMGWMDNRNLLYLAGKAEARMVSDEGEGFCPERIETAVTEASSLISRCVLYRSGSSYTSCLLTLDRQSCLDYLAGKEEKPASVQACKRLLERVNEELLEFRPGGKFRGSFPEEWLPAVAGILPQGFNLNDGTLDSSLNAVRGKVFERWKEELDFLYTPEGKDIRNVRNTANMKRFMEEGA